MKISEYIILGIFSVKLDQKMIVYTRLLRIHNLEIITHVCVCVAPHMTVGAWSMVLVLYMAVLLIIY